MVVVGWTSSSSNCLEGDFHLGLLWMLFLCIELRGTITLAKVFVEVHVFTINVDNCNYYVFVIACNFSLDHKNSSSTTTWGWRKFYVYVDLQLHYTLQQLLLCTLALLKMHQIETKVTFKDQGNCKIYCVPIFFIVYCTPSFHNIHVCQ